VRKLFSIFLLFSLLGGIAGCGPWGSTRPIVKIGLVAPFEGLYRPLGYEVLPAVKLALREWNEAGGVQGYMVELVALNDGQDPTTAAQRAREMVVDPDIMGVIGHFSDETTLAAMSTYDQASLALVVPMATAVEVTGRGYPQTFRLGADNNLLGRTAAHYAVIERGARRLAVIRGQEDLVNSFIGAALEEGAMIVLDLKVEAEDLVTALAEERPEAIFFAGGALEGGELLLRLREAGLEIPLLGGNGLDSPHLVQIAGDGAEGTAYVTITPPVEDQDFIEAYTALSGAPPGPYAALAYDATQLLLNALRKAITVRGKPTREGVAAALSQGEGYDGLTGYISFDERGQALNRRAYIYEIVNGRYPGELRR
jgi:branched-chain amino acid transport system substrate-binding protein